MCTTARQLHQSLYENEEFELDIPFIHYAYSLIQPRLVNFSELVHAFPNLVEEMLKLRDRLIDGEMVSPNLEVVSCSVLKYSIVYSTFWTNLQHTCILRDASLTASYTLFP